MYEKRTCPYCGVEAFQRRTINTVVVIDEELGEVISVVHDDYHRCPYCNSVLYDYDGENNSER